MGRPKALVELDGVPLVLRALRALADGGCAPLLVVTGAAADEVAEIVSDTADVVFAPDWADGMGASLRAGLARLSSFSGTAPDSPYGTGLSPGTGPEAALVQLVDLPGVGAAAIARLCTYTGGPDVLARAAYGGLPGHPVLLGRRHWPGVRAAATGDSGARGYLAGNAELRLVECGDIADPRDVDTPDALRGFAGPSR
jgi:nicotine blue oxidoreductase